MSLEPGGGLPLHTRNLYITHLQAPVAVFRLQAIIDLKSRLVIISPINIGSIHMITVDFFCFLGVKNEQK